VEYLDEALGRRDPAPEEEDPEGNEDETTCYSDPPTSDESESSEESESSWPPQRWVRPKEKEV
jgi:hypothetical protein